MKYFALLLLATQLTACYRMPTEDDFSTIPTTNNPDVTRQKGGYQPNMVNY